MIRDEILEVLELQAEYSAENTPAMRRRGKIIRNEIREQFNANATQLQSALQRTYAGSLSFEGGDGTGRKTFIPWHRLFVDTLSPSPQEGWYVVYLFKADGSGAYLCLSHGSTRFDGMSFNPRPDEEMAALVEFARDVLSDEFKDADQLQFQIDLAQDGTLGTAYPKSTAAAIYYPAGNIPTDEYLAKNLCQFLEWLGTLYAAVELGRAPATVCPEQAAVNELVSPTSARGQGRGLNAKERRAVELHAMMLAQQKLKALGYKVKDVSSKQSYDFEATNALETICVEVKGTTGPAGSIMLTSNEVTLHRNRYPHNALFVVHGVELIRGDEPEASGGTLAYAKPWKLEDGNLKPTTYELRSPLEGCVVEGESK